MFGQFAVWVVAFFTPSQEGYGSGFLNRSFPTGASAYGIPLKNVQLISLGHITSTIVTNRVSSLQYRTFQEAKYKYHFVSKYLYCQKTQTILIKQSIMQ